MTNILSDFPIIFKILFSVCIIEIIAWIGLTIHIELYYKKKKTE